MRHHRCGGILDDGLAFVVKYGQLSTKPWSTSGEVNVYEFFSKFEEWSAGTLSENQKAY
jgi:hypothetical protein